MKKLMLFALVFLAACGINTSPGEGEKIGQIVKLNKQGIFNDTWEAELIRGGMTGGSGVVGIQPFDFTISSDSEADIINTYLKNQTEVVIKYRMEGIWSLFRSESNGHFLVSISPVDSVKSNMFIPLLIASLALVQKPETLSTVKVVVESTRGSQKAPITQKTYKIGDLGNVDISQDMPLLLNATPSVTTYSENGAYNGYAYMRLRGIDQSRINMTLNGVPLNEPEDQGVYFANFPDFSHFVNSLQVQRGVGTTSYGTASYAGSVNFESVSPWTSGRAIDYNHNQFLAGEYTFRTPSTAGFTRFTRQNVAGYRDNSDNRSWVNYVSADVLKETRGLRVTAFVANSNNELAWAPSPLSEIRKNPMHNPLTEAETDEFSQKFASVMYQTRVSPRIQSNTSVYYNSIDGHYNILIGEMNRFNLDGSWVGLIHTNEYRQNGLVVNTGLHGYRYRRHHSLTLPASNTGAYFNTGRRGELSGFVKAQYDRRNVSLLADLQLRSTWFAYLPDKASGLVKSDVDWTFVNPKVGISYLGVANTKFYGFVGQTSREPTRNDLFGGFDNLDTSNVSFVGSLNRVQPERVRNVELGVEHSGTRAGIAANVFHMQFHNEIAPIGQLSYIGLPLRKNVETSYRQGVEVDARYKVSSALMGEGNVTLMRSRISKYENDIVGQTFSNVQSLLTPKALGNVQVTYTLGGAATTVRGRYVGQSYLDNENTQILPSATLFDVKETVTIGRISVTAQLSNIFNRLTFGSGTVGATEPLYFVNTLRNLSIFGRLTL
jgi:iron complex outermembrane recepter protein